MNVFLELLDSISPSMYQELLDLDGIVQDVHHHPEGDALQHTIYVVDAAERIAAREGLLPRDMMILLNAALTHDLGKASTTVVHDDGRITAYGHPEAGVVPAQNMLQRLGVDQGIIDNVLPLVREHMAWVGFYMSEITPKGVKRLARRLQPSNMEMWALVVEADMSGRPPKPAGLPTRAGAILDLAREFGINKGTID